MTVDDRAVEARPSHESWSSLADHLQAAFPQLDRAVIVRQLVAARDTVDLFGLSAEAGLETAERIVRHELRVMTGETLDNARISPETHHRRGRDE